MPTLKELFQNKIITEGPNAGKTAEDAYAIRNSKDMPIGSSNFLLQAINKNTTGGLVGKVINGFDFVEKVNERRKRYSIKDGESFVEQEQVGLKQFATFARPVIYGGDIFRISNRRTRTLSYIKEKASLNTGLLGVSDSIANAAGNFAGDYINNLFAGKKGKESIPPPPDLMSLGTELAVNVADRALGALLPMPMVPSKVATEIQQRGGKGNEDFNREYNRDRAIKKLANQAKVPGFVDGLLKQNKNLISQPKDIISSVISRGVGNLVKTGVRSLIDKGVKAVIKNKKNANIAKQIAGGSKTIIGKEDTPWSSQNPYGKSVDYETTKPISEQTTLKAIFLQWRAEQLKAQGVQLPDSAPSNVPYNFGPDDTIPDDVRLNADEDLYKALNREKPPYSNSGDVFSKRRDNARGLATRGDTINLSDDVIYKGTEVIDTETQRSFDSFDFIPLKFYSVGTDTTVQFRCTVTDFVETFTPEWEPHKFIGNPFSFYTYNGVERSCTFSFKVFSLSLIEHMNVWRKLDALGKLTMPQAFKGAAGAVVPPIIKFTLGDLYINKPAYIETLIFSVNQDSPWEIGLNEKMLDGTQTIAVPNVAGYSVFLEPDITSGNHKLPMIMDIEVGLKFLESRATVENANLYGYELPKLVDSVDKNNKPVPPNYFKL